MANNLTHYAEAQIGAALLNATNLTAPTLYFGLCPVTVYTISTAYTLNQIVVMPQGYARALKWLLARELWTEFMGGSPLPTLMAQMAAESSRLINAANRKPQKVATYDRELVRDCFKRTGCVGADDDG